MNSRKDEDKKEEWVRSVNKETKKRKDKESKYKGGWIK